MHHMQRAFAKAAEHKGAPQIERGPGCVLCIFITIPDEASKIKCATGACTGCIGHQGGESQSGCTAKDGARGRECPERTHAVWANGRVA